MTTTTNGRELWHAAGEWLRVQRENRGLSQRQLSSILGPSYQSISNYERGISAPADDTCERIARLFNVPVTEVRERWGKYNQPTRRKPAPPPVVSIEEAVVADERLLPEAKQHLLNQIELLLRITPRPDDVGAARRRAAAAKDAEHNANALRVMSSDGHEDESDSERPSR